MFAALGRFTVRFRWLIIAGWIVATVVLSLTLPSLTSVEKSSNSQFLPASRAERAGQQLVAPFSSGNPGHPFVAATSGAALTAGRQRRHRPGEQALRSMPRVTAVVDQGVSATAGPAGPWSRSSSRLLRRKAGHPGRRPGCVHARHLRPPAGLALHLTGGWPPRSTNRPRTATSRP